MAGLAELLAQYRQPIVPLQSFQPFTAAYDPNLAGTALRNKGQALANSATVAQMINAENARLDARRDKEADRELRRQEAAQKQAAQQATSERQATQDKTAADLTAAKIAALGAATTSKSKTLEGWTPSALSSPVTSRRQVDQDVLTGFDFTQPFSRTTPAEQARGYTDEDAAAQAAQDETAKPADWDDFWSIPGNEEAYQEAFDLAGDPNP